MTKNKAVCILLSLFICAYVVTFPVTEGQGADSAVNQAQKTLSDITQVVAKAQSEGANVDALMVTLTQAADLLSKAQLANSAGDFSTANDYASQCQSILSGVADEASSLQQEAANQKSQSSIFTVLTLLVSAALLASGIVSWFVLNKRERRSITDGSKSL